MADKSGKGLQSSPSNKVGGSQTKSSTNRIATSSSQNVGGPAGNLVVMLDKKNVTPRPLLQLVPRDTMEELEKRTGGEGEEVEEDKEEEPEEPKVATPVKESQDEPVPSASCRSPSF